MKLLNLTDIHKSKMLCYYKKHLENKLPTYISSMFTQINLQDRPTPPRTKLFENTLRFRLHNYLHTAPTYLIQQVHNVSFSHLKYKIKRYFIENYSSMCTTVGCQVCRMAYIQYWICTFPSWESTWSTWSWARDVHSLELDRRIPPLTPHLLPLTPYFLAMNSDTP